MLLKSQNKSENHIYFAPFKTKQKTWDTTYLCMFLTRRDEKRKEINKKGNK